MLHRLLALLMVLCWCVEVRSDETPVAVTELRCEYLVDPLGIDVARPRLSWQIKDERRGAAQTAYQVLVASTPEKLAADEGDLWDSGRVATEQSIHLIYAGKPLTSHQSCFWKVRVWDQDGRASAFSQPARWSMGILKPDQWQAKWLRYTNAPPREVTPGSAAALLNFDAVQWIWTTAADANQKAPQGKAFFRREVEIPRGSYVKWAYLLITADDSYALTVNGGRTNHSQPRKETWRRGREVELTDVLVPGKNLIAVEVANATEGPAGLAAKLVVEMADGQRIVVVSDEQWLAAPGPSRYWNHLHKEFDPSGFSAAKPIGPVGIEPWGVPKVGYALGFSQAAPSPMFRKGFRVERPIKSATVYICGLGYHDLHVNGQKVGDHVLDPAMTRYDRRALYVTHDVTDLVKQGDNALGVMLGNSWYNMHTRAIWDFDNAPWRDEPTLLCHLRIELADGTVQTIVSDRSWRASTGPVWVDSIRSGEHYDARREMPGWDTAAFDDSAWSEPQVVDGPRGVLSAQMMAPMRVTKTIKPVGITEPRPGVYIVDLGQNIAGFAQLRVEGRAGTRVQLRYGETLDEQGLLKRYEIAKHIFEGPFQTDVYVLKGQGEEVWQPRFVYHGFRYIEVTGMSGPPTLDSIRGQVVHTDWPLAGSFACSNHLLNDLQRLTLWSYRGNFHGYPTDCPQREKNGWTGDAHLATEQAMYNAHNAPGYAKWVQDLHDEQQDDGNLPGIVPTSGWGYAWGNGPAWDSSLVLIPWYMYQYRGDIRVLAQHYDRMKRYVDFMGSRSKDHIADFGLGDWIPAKTQTPRDLTSTGYYFADAMIVAQTAKLLGKLDDARRYGELAATIRKAFNEKFYQGDGIYANGSQTALSCPVYQGLVDPQEKARVVEQLAANVQASDDHLDVGILGVKYLFRTLSENGQHEAAYRIATQTTRPSFGLFVKRGATTLWEDWDGLWSLNHIMFGDISAWFYQYLAGIQVDPAQPGFKHIIIHPRPAGDLTWVKATTETMYGVVRSAWKKTDAAMQLDVTVPPNTSATVYVPTSKADAVQESGQPAANVPGVKFLRAEDGCAVFEVPAGQYRFTAPK